MSEDLLRLAERVGQEQGPSYELDCAIWDAVYPGERQARFDKLTAKGQPYHGRLGPADMDGYVRPLRAFTASMDAAMTLVPEWFCVSAMGEVPDDLDWYCCLWGEHESDGEPERRAKTLPLAITSAALRARASIGKGE
ncbi:hypothetical protein [Sphingobium sp. CFD-1]|uniref:hypothetical protein n=1 Tax=Sphingobium sp. CFD-1 TaxID=2878545 RepID=UPI00214BF3FA|nr:hypothetical protein [Sphingobium sp. CFD-1]